MAIKYEKIGDRVYAVDTNNPLVYRNISGYDSLNAPSNAVKVGPNQYNTTENILMQKEAEAQFEKQKREKEIQAQIEAKKSQEQKQAEAQAQVTSVPHVTSPAYSSYLSEEEIKKKTAQTIAEKIAPTIASNSIGKIIEKIHKETKGAPSLEQARVEGILSQIQDNQKIIQENKMSSIRNIKIGTPVVLPHEPVINVAYLGGIASLVARVGTALWGFVSRNPKTIGATVSTTALADAITQTAKTEGEKNQILWEIGQQNPQLVSQIAQEIAQTKANPIANIADTTKYAVIGIAGLILLYLFSKKN